MKTHVLQYTRDRCTSRQKGLSLVELMVAMTIGLFLTAGILALFIGTKQGYRTTDAVSRLQENGRFAIEYLSRGIREAGSKGSCTTTVNSLLDDTATDYTDDRFDLNDFIKGWDGISTDDDPGTPKFDTKYVLSGYEHNTDVILIKDAALLSGLSATSQTAPTATTVALTGPNNSPNSIILISDWDGCDQFQNRSANNASTLSRDSDPSTPGPGNKDDSTNSFNQTYDINVEILLFRSRLFFIATGANGEPALWERRFDQGFDPTDIQEDEIVDGVYDMQIRYLTESGTSYVDAADVTDWDDVNAVRIELLLGSADDNLVDEQMKLPYRKNDDSFYDATNPLPDRRMYQMFTTTIALRNRLP